MPVSSIWGKPLKIFACFMFFLAALGNAYFSVEGAIKSEETWGAVVILVVGLSIAGLMLLVLYGALKTETQEFVIGTRLLLRHGFGRMKAMSPDEYERQAKLERSIDSEIAESNPKNK